MRKILFKLGYFLPKNVPVKLFKYSFKKLYLFSRHPLSGKRADFMSQLVKKNCTLYDTRKINATSYRSQTDGLIECYNTTLCTMLSMYVGNNQRD